MDNKLKGSQLDNEVKQHFDSMGIANTEAQSQRIVSLVKNIKNRASTILCAPTMTGKTILLKVCFKTSTWYWDFQVPQKICCRLPKWLKIRASQRTRKLKSSSYIPSLAHLWKKCLGGLTLKRIGWMAS